MVSFSNIACKTVGVAGMSAVLYDAYCLSKAQAKRTSQQDNADFYEKIYADTRYSSNESPITNAMQKKVANLRMNNPIVPTVGNIKGCITGFFRALGDNIIPAAFASLALAGKGIFAKIGAIGVAACGLFTLLKEGFGFSKKSPMD